MRSRVCRASVGWVLCVMVAAPAWATCVSALTVIGTPNVCPMQTVHHCPHQDGPRANGNCCLVDTTMPASNVPVAVTPLPLSRLVPTLGPPVPMVDGLDSSTRSAFVEARTPLKTDKRPTYLRLSTLLI